MILQEQLLIHAPRDVVWSRITDIENFADCIEGIDQIEILEKPASGLVGLKWRETRTVFGKTAVEVMWVTAVTENESYQSTAESHGSRYITTRSVSEQGDNTVLVMSHESQPLSFMAKVMSVPLGFLFKGMLKKCIVQDLGDLKVAIENAGNE